MFNVIIEDGWKTSKDVIGSFCNEDQARKYVNHVFGGITHPGLLGNYWTFDYEYGMDSNCKHYISIEQA